MTADIAWTARPELGRVFLVQYRSSLERRLLQEWIDTSREAGAADAPVRMLRIPSRHRAARGRGAVDTLLEPLSSGEQYFLVPLRVIWMPAPGDRQIGPNPLKLLFGDPRSPGRIAQRLIYRRDPGRARVLVAEGASLDELRARFRDLHGGSAPDPSALANFVHRQAVLALERAERNVRGSRYKVPRMLTEEVLSKPRLVKALAEEAERSGRPLAEVLDEARGCLSEMAPELKTWALDAMAGLGRYLYTRGFDPKIDYLDEDLARVRRLSAEHPIAFLMTHKSHLDGFLLIYIFYDLDMPPVHVFGGINMSFLGLGALGKRSGAIWIRRNMTGDNIYKAVFKQYIDYLAEKRFPLLWALEGTRSRTGKLMPPRYGLINYVVDSYVRAASTDMVLMPVAIGYDQVPEVRDYIAEQKGIAKRPESASWFMQYISGLRNPFGRIHVRFGKGIKLSEVLGEPRPDLAVTPLDIQKIAFRLAVDANSVTPVLGTALITFVLSAAGRKAMTLTELAAELRAMVRLVRRLELPTTGEVQFADMGVLNRTLDQMVRTGVLLRYDEDDEPLYAIDVNATMAAAYYRNGAVHFLVNGAIAELAILHVAQQASGHPMEAFHAEALRIRDTLKFEFFFEEKSEFLEQIARDLDVRAPGWRESLGEGGEGLFGLIVRINPLLAAGALRPFLESYLLLAETLAAEPPGEPVDDKALIRKCMSLGRLRALQQRISSEESVSKSYLENGLRLAQSRGLLREDAEGIGQSREEFLSELRSLVRRTGFIAAVAENRRIGVDPAAGIANL